MDWLRMFTVFVFLIIFSGNVIAGSRKKIRIHIPQKVKHMNYHKKVYLPNPLEDSDAQYSPSNNYHEQYAPGYTAASEIVPTQVLPLDQDTTELTPLKSMYRKRGHYGPKYGKSKRNKNRLRGRRMKASKIPSLRRKKTSRKSGKRHRRTKKFMENNSNNNLIYDYDYESLQEPNANNPITIRAFSRPKRVEKHMDKDGGHMHTFTEEHIHQIVYDDPTSKYGEEDAYYRKPYYENEFAMKPTQIYPMILDQPYSTINSMPGVISGAYQNIIPSTLIALPSNTYDQYTNLELPKSSIKQSMTFRPMHPYQTSDSKYYPASNGNMGTPSHMEYMDYDPKEATYDHTVHNHGEIQNVEQVMNYNYNHNDMYKDNPFLNKLPNKNYNYDSNYEDEFSDANKPRPYRIKNTNDENYVTSKPWMTHSKPSDDNKPWITQTKHTEDNKSWMTQTKLSEENKPWMTHTKPSEDNKNSVIKPWLTRIKHSYDEGRHYEGGKIWITSMKHGNEEDKKYVSSKPWPPRVKDNEEEMKPWHNRVKNNDEEEKLHESSKYRPMRIKYTNEDDRTYESNKYLPKYVQNSEEESETSWPNRMKNNNYKTPQNWKNTEDPRYEKYKTILKNMEMNDGKYNDQPVTTSYFGKMPVKPTKVPETEDYDYSTDVSTYSEYPPTTKPLFTPVMKLYKSPKPAYETSAPTVDENYFPEGERGSTQIYKAKVIYHTTESPKTTNSDYSQEYSGYPDYPLTTPKPNYTKRVKYYPKPKQVYEPTPSTVEDVMYSDDTTESDYKYKTKVKIYPSPTKATSSEDYSTDGYSTQNAHMSTNKPMFTTRVKSYIRHKPNYDAPPSTIEDVLSDNDSGHKYKAKLKYYSTESPKTTSHNYDHKGFYETKQYHDNVKDNHAFSNDNSYDKTKDRFREYNPQPTRGPHLKDSYGFTSPESLKYEMDLFTKNKMPTTNPMPMTNSGGIFSNKNRNKFRSVSQQSVSFGGKERVTVVNHMQDRPKEKQDYNYSARESRHDEEAMVPEPTPTFYQNGGLSTLRYFDNPKETDSLLTERSFSVLDSTLIPETTSYVLPSIKPTKSTLRPMRKFRRLTSTTPASSFQPNTAINRSRSSLDKQTNVEITEGPNPTNIVTRRQLNYGDKV